MCKKKLLLLITNSGIGGAQNVFYEQANTLREFYEITECYYSLDDGEPPNSLNKIITLNNRPGNNIIQKLIYFIQRIKKIRSIKKNDSYFACISHMEGANWVNILSGRPHGTSLIPVIHGSLIKDRNRGVGLKKFFMNRILVPFIYRRASLVVCVSESIKAELDRFTRKPDLSIALPNYFDIKRIIDQSEEVIEEELKGYFRSHKVLITVARLAWEKNHFSLLKIYEHIRKLDTSYRLLIVGDGAMYEELVTFSQSLGLSTYSYKSNALTCKDFDVVFLGMRDNPYKYLRLSFAFLLTSYNEGFPLVLGEAMTCGIPVISYDCTSGPKQILAPDIPENQRIFSVYFGCNGILIPEQKRDDIDKIEIAMWETAIRRLSDDALYYDILRKNGFDRIQYFSRENIIRNWFSLLDDPGIFQ
jgi:glycosyltransferase involved in cell wall biosynthesis